MTEFVTYQAENYYFLRPQATLSKLLTYCVIRSTQPPTLSGMGNEYRSLGATEWRPSVAAWGGGMFVSCKPQVPLFADAGNGWPHSALPYH